ncbi:MAG: alpha/beta fold hydrolase [Chloroflexaceae bacterium]|nr:alpha/beta fold hydrolase [Chloroflexaceae bacterium]
MQADINGITLSYEDRGQGLAVLLIHAFPMSGALWQQQISALETDYRVIVPDLRGFGSSTIAKGPYPMDTFADDLVTLLDRLAIKQAVIGGLSMGGYIALALLERYPERVQGLILADTRATADTAEARGHRETTAKMVETEGSAAIADRMLPNLLSPQTTAEKQAFVRSLIEANLPQGIAGALRGMALRRDSTELLASITVPTLILVGADDMLSPPAEMETMHQAIAGSQFVIIPTAGHVANIDNPDAFNEALRQFLLSFEAFER